MNKLPTARRALVGLAAGVLACTAACAPEPAGSSNLASTVRDFAGTRVPDAAYRPPDPGERSGVAGALNLAITGNADAARSAFAPFGFDYRVDTDAETGRRYGLAVQEPAGERAWGLYVIDLDTPPRVVVEVPHPNFDLGTEEVGLALFRARPGVLLAVAGTHRHAANGAGDVAHRVDSMFHALVTGLGLPQVQVHGFSNASLPGTDVVLSTGAGEVTEEAREVADALGGPRVCLAWAEQCGKLEGARNAQGRAAAENGTVFLHVEMNRAVRDDRVRWERVVAALSLV
ncbi:hypothetical protein ACOBQX_08610 [Actinokineospora sp. G85]|uniref:hypothetical protein n=1 Tax=Actinokineospora sp. G85 TaxID=3406626 RepID=UPI003C713B2B